MTYKTEILADNPSHWWRVKEPIGNLSMDVGSGLAPLLHTGVGLGFSGVANDDLSIYSTGGANSKSVTSSVSDLAPVPYTVECWVYILAAAGAGLTATLIRQETAANGWSIGYNNGWFVYDIRASVKTNHNIVGAVALNTWHQFAITHDGANLRAYLNGAQDGAANASLGHQTFTATLGINDQNPQTFLIAEAAIYPIALSAARILAHYDAADYRLVRPVYVGIITQSDLATAETQILGDTALIRSDTGNILDAVRRTYS